MIVDFHTHVFPDRIAPQTIDFLAKKGGIPPFTDGTVAGLLQRMEEADVSLSVTLPVLTNPDKFESVNTYAMEINRHFEGKPRRLLSFAAIHPCCTDIESKVAWIADNGFLGIKLHPDYQETFFDSEGYLRILCAAKQHDLIVLTHAGVDCGFYGMPQRCTPERARRVIDAVPYGKLVLAHLGGIDCYSDVLELLCGCNVYLDTAFVLRFTGEDRFKEILKRHGEDRLLFASDCPWSTPAADIATLRSFGLEKATLDKLFFQNAKKLLAI